ncbi:hypothetical protein GMRT_13779 [Giardia muris]|uniref:Uncharacterized protein n=1 Tax=Giardia muris TaxID=5742 RepID=A0A4Z1SSJ4_GIAMU|nr:hypothetical protein GMRT_13779 [Giardia muris]|eukprot:TNJ28750.1 hypothetical protein GMRT_13779 [Giardia muris]
MAEYPLLDAPLIELKPEFPERVAKNYLRCVEVFKTLVQFKDSKRKEFRAADNEIGLLFNKFKSVPGLEDKQTSEEDSTQEEDEENDHNIVVFHKGDAFNGNDHIWTRIEHKLVNPDERGLCMCLALAHKLIQFFPNFSETKGMDEERIHALRDFISKAPKEIRLLDLIYTIAIVRCPAAFGLLVSLENQRAYADVLKQGGNKVDPGPHVHAFTRAILITTLASHSSPERNFCREIQEDIFKTIGERLTLAERTRDEGILQQLSELAIGIGYICLTSDDFGNGGNELAIIGFDDLEPEQLQLLCKCYTIPIGHNRWHREALMNRVTVTTAAPPPRQ